MSQQDELVERGRRLLLNNYRQAPVVMARGEGCALWDVEGRRYLDMTAGIAVCDARARRTPGWPTRSPRRRAA